MGETRLLIVDREPEIRSRIKTHATLEGFVSDEATDGITALKQFRRNNYTIVILDANCVELDAWHVCRQIRKSANTPIIVLSMRNDEQQKLSFFDLGVDDFVTKPFSCRVLMARVHVILRRNVGYKQRAPRRIVYEGLSIDTAAHMVYVDGENVLMTPKEYKLLVFLAQNPNQAMSREMILKEVWGEDFFGTDRTVDTHIKMLRESLRPYHTYVETVWGFGYIFNAKDT